MAWRRRIQLSSRQVFIGLMLLSAVLLLLPRRWTDRADHLLTMAAAPFTSSSRQMSLAVTEKIHGPGDDVVDAEKYKRLESEYLRQRVRLTNVNQHVEELEELVRVLSGLNQKFSLARANLIITSVIGNASTSWQQMLNLDSGSLDHVQAGQVVLGPVRRDDPVSKDGDASAMSVIGRIHKVGLRTSDVQLISDPGFSLPVSVIPRWDREQNWRAEGILQGQGMGKIEVKMVPVQGHPVRVGDVVLACSDPDYLPVEMITAVVSRCVRDDTNPLIWRIEVKSASQLDRLTRLIVVDTQWNRGEEAR